ncbi:magnesium-dependent phosphatase-1 [Pelagicoccus albus]|uniref:Magnesium-dependent phosphatase-1 n=1 Tax=Pelagicoccus albus TaxID=415222 RepID=A0A7X1BAC2_9BACT|nr:magnesium-dependent phosphatase-1 [Pelagicoccus albus]MBC2607333.1 magnesium-dependent phosphatase-1 [Pelagicoccus albus]
MAQAPFKLVVFDLDFTVWDAGGVWCDCLEPPFRKESGKVVDSRGSVVLVYDGIQRALRLLNDLGVPIAIASRTTRPDWARTLLDLLELRAFFSYEEIYPSSKVRHFEALRRDSGVDYEEMLFFDDESRNIVEVSELGVKAVLVREGFSPALFGQAFR